MQNFECNSIALYNQQIIQILCSDTLELEIELAHTSVSRRMSRRNQQGQRASISSNTHHWKSYPRHRQMIRRWLVIILFGFDFKDNILSMSRFSRCFRRRRYGGMSPRNICSLTTRTVCAKSQWTLRNTSINGGQRERTTGCWMRSLNDSEV